MFYRVILALVTLFPLYVFSQTVNPPVSWEEKMKAAGLVDVQALVPDILIDLKYATQNNFLKENVYGDFRKCYLRKEVADKLASAQKYLEKFHPGLRLLVFDCARPRSVQYKMWELVKGTKKQGYVANPSRGSIHNFGLAVDLSISGEKGTELDMGTPFDYFGDLAQPVLEKKLLSEKKLSQEQVHNREILRSIMKRAGFYGIPNEWWHFEALGRDQVMREYKMIE